MEMHYKFDLKTQSAYGLRGVLLSLAILYVILGKMDWIAALVAGIGNFLVSGFYTDYARNC